MTSALSAAEWDAFLEAQTAYPPTLSTPSAHVLQSAAWAGLKTQYGWTATRIAVRESGAIVAGAQVLFRPLPLALGAVAYVPRGPLVDWTNRDLTTYLLALIDEAAHSQRAVFLKMEADLLDSPEARSALASYGLEPSPQSIQPRRTLLIDLRAGEDEILARMKQKTRYNIRLAAKRGVTVRCSDSGSFDADMAAFTALMEATSARDGFGAHTPGYYRQAYEQFAGRGQVALLIAEYEARPLAAVMAFALAGRAWYFYGASSDAERQRMPAYAAQWEALRWAKARGCHTYDLWGVPDADRTELEAQFTTRTDGLWPVYRFKRGFGGELARVTAAHDRVYMPRVYRLYRWYVRRRSALSNARS